VWLVIHCSNLWIVSFKLSVFQKSFLITAGNGGRIFASARLFLTISATTDLMNFLFSGVLIQNNVSISFVHSLDLIRKRISLFLFSSTTTFG